MPQVPESQNTSRCSDGSEGVISMDWKLAAVIVAGIIAWFVMLGVAVDREITRELERRKTQAECFAKTKREECWK